MKIKIFNIFHEKVFDELIENIPPEQRDIVVMYGVNENIKKQSEGIMKTMKIKEFHARIRKIMKILEIHLRFTKIMQIS